MAEMRTTAQVEADKLDDEMYRLAGRLEAFSATVQCPHIDEVSRRLFQARGVVRKHMHRRDREETND